MNKDRIDVTVMRLEDDGLKEVGFFSVNNIFIVDKYLAPLKFDSFSENIFYKDDGYGSEVCFYAKHHSYRVRIRVYLEIYKNGETPILNTGIPVLYCGKQSFIDNKLSIRNYIPSNFTKGIVKDFYRNALNLYDGADVLYKGKNFIVKNEQLIEA